MGVCGPSGFVVYFGAARRVCIPTRRVGTRKRGRYDSLIWRIELDPSALGQALQRPLILTRIADEKVNGNASHRLFKRQRCLMTLAHRTLGWPRSLALDVEIDIAPAGVIVDPGAEQPDPAVLTVMRLQDRNDFLPLGFCESH